MVADFLEGDGWEVLNLGASTPARDLARHGRRRAARRGRPLDRDARRAARARPRRSRRCSRSDPRPLVVLGGQLWPGPARADAPSLGADLVVDGPRELVALLRERFPPQPADAEERGF